MRRGGGIKSRSEEVWQVDDGEEEEEKLEYKTAHIEMNKVC